MAYTHNEAAEFLFKTIAALPTAELCRAFMEDLCTIQEIRDMSQRLETAVLLRDGCSYQDIAERLGISTATISRVNRALQYGSDGYKAAIELVRDGEGSDGDT